MISNRENLKLISGILTGILLCNLSIFSAPFYIGALIDGLGFNEIQAGLVNTFEVGTVACVTLVFANYLNRISLRYLALTGALVILLANLVTLAIDGYLPLLFVRTLAGTGTGLCLAASSALLRPHEGPGSRNGDSYGMRYPDPDPALVYHGLCQRAIDVRWRGRLDDYRFTVNDSADVADSDPALCNP